ncbi:MAG: sporulation protein YunB [Ruminiclostridium sp.]|nr:sporulation protein YunB [Ruminiclostridium sp.]
MFTAGDDMAYCTQKDRKRKIFRIAGTVLVCAGLLCAGALALIEAFIRPTLVTLLDYKCRMAAERIISDAVFERFGEGNGYDDIVKFTFDNNGRIAALNTDRAKINSLKALLNGAVNDGLDRLSEENVGISVGTLTGISLFYGTGAELMFHIEPKGKADTRLVSSLESAGINQTMHSIILEVDAVISPMMPGFTETVDVSYDILLAQTVIVGSVPDSYSYIVLDEANKTELANIDV